MNVTELKTLAKQLFITKIYKRWSEASSLENEKIDL
jgi:hypothetical protein